MILYRKGKIMPKLAPSTVLIEQQHSTPTLTMPKKTRKRRTFKRNNQSKTHQQVRFKYVIRFIKNIFFTRTQMRSKNLFNHHKMNQ